MSIRRPTAAPTSVRAVSRQPLHVALALALCACGLAAAAEDERAHEAAIARFAAWAQMLAKPDSPEAVSRGIALARERAEAMASLIRTHPERALAARLRHAERRQLPAAVQALVEEPIDASGELQELVELRPDRTSQTRYVAVIGGRTYEAHIAGDRRPSGRGQRIALHGVAVGGVVAISDSPVRLLDAGERPDARKRIADRRCPVSKKAGDPAILADAGDVVYALCDVAHAEVLGNTLIAAETVDASTPDVAWTVGAKRLLFMRIDVADQRGDPVSDSDAQQVLNVQMKNYFIAASSGRTSITSTIIPTLHLPGPASDYADINVRRSATYAAARAAGYEPDDFDREIICSSVSTWPVLGLGSVNAKACWLNGIFSDWACCHEQGHCMGVRHANAWNPTAGDPVGPGAHEEYGDPFDNMGGGHVYAGGVLVGQFCAYSKNYFGWIPDANVTHAASPGVYRITAHDTAFDPALRYGIYLEKDWSRTYWIDYRSLQANGGAEVRWAGGLDQRLGTELIRLNANVLAVGSSLVDSRRGVTFTAVGMDSAASPPWVDVSVSFQSVPNTAPVAQITAVSPDPLTGAGPFTATFTGAGSDADGDYLQYTIDYGDGQAATVLPSPAAGNPAPFVHTFIAAGTYHVTLTARDYGGLTGTAAVDVHVTSDSPYGSVQFSASGYSAAEGNSGVTSVPITVTRTGGTSGPVSVTCATAGGGTADGSDYIPASAVLTWQDGDGSAKTFTVQVRGDTTYESDDTVLIRLSAPTGGVSIGSPGSAVLTVVNDDGVATPGALQFSSVGFTQVEGNSGTANATITVTRTGGSSGAVSVGYATSNGTATAGSDYVATSGTLSWADGDAAAKSFTVAITGDTLVEPDETVALTLTSPTGGATLGAPSTATLTITNDDVAPAGSLQFSAATYTVTEGDSGATTATITVRRVGGAAGAVAVAYATADGTADASDYLAAAGTLSWADGDAADKTFTVSVRGDTAVEPNETVLLSLVSPTGGASLGLATATLTIGNDDVGSGGVVGFVTATSSVPEGDSGFASALIAIRRTGACVGAASVRAAVVGGSAVAGTDYTMGADTATWADGEGGDRTVGVRVLGNTAVQLDRTVGLALVDASGAALGASTTTLVIVDDDRTRSSGISGSTVGRGSLGTHGCGFGSGFATLVLALALHARSRAR